MGWNSWDCFATTVTEAQTKAQADFMAERLAPYGWQYIVVDIQWYEPEARSFDYRKNARLAMDEYGRLWPATNRFPSSANGVGFKALSDYVHGKGLKFGVHLLRGIPRQAVAANTRVKGASASAAGVADTNSMCQWNGDMYGVDMTRLGAQAYYDSVFVLLADWGVDFVKVDDIARPYHKAEIEAIRKAIDRTGRPMILSLSPGETPVAEGEHVSMQANLWRISDDFWDKWQLLFDQFERLRQWTPYRGAGHFPDADMLPLGTIGLGRKTKFTLDEQYTLMTLWSIARSPLILGADMTKLDGFTLSLLTNAEVIAVNQHSSGNRQFLNRDGFIGWMADAPADSGKYVALFNTRDTRTNQAAARITVPFADLGLTGKCQVRDLWAQKDLGQFEDQLLADLKPHGAVLYRISSAGFAAGGAPAAYLFSYFINNGEDGLHLAASRDGYRWEALGGGRSFLTPKVGESKLMRDPCLLRRPDGTFHLVWTTAWGGGTIGYASSKDLVHWSQQRALQVMSQESASINCWAPEIFWDDQKQDFLIFWASTVTNKFLETAGQSENRYNHRMYCTTTRDFQAFSPSRLFYDPGFSVIDATLVGSGGRYYLVIKDERVKPPKKHLRIAVADHPEGPFSAPGLPFTRDWVEGPTVLPVEDGCIVYFDCYRDGHYGAMKSQDLAVWEDVTAKLSMPRGVRHGTAIRVPPSFLDDLVRVSPGG